MHVQDALGVLPDALREELLVSFNRITTNYREGRWEPAELNAGKLSEIVYAILEGYVAQSYPLRAIKPTNMVDACKRLEHAGSSVPRTVRIQMPRVLVALYEIRNHRGVSHIGGDVNPNQMDATMVLYASKWLIAELVRLLHNVEMHEAGAIVEELTTKETPLVWSVNGRKRILNTKLSMKQKTLLLLYSESQPVDESVLFDWIEHSNRAAFRRDVLARGHKSRLWEYDRSSSTVTLSPVGKSEVEAKMLNYIA
ncbi:hypothetical protein F4X86_01470 [Candidatus Saccharibacteria bacterium]|nr:hypothetical protein [Candidatus Saccharibacteria bacterium]